MSTEIELPPCPFCGGRPTLAEDKYSSADATAREWLIICASCAAEMWGESRAHAIEKWKKRGGWSNTRVSLVKPDVPIETFKYIERLRELADRVERGELGAPTCGVVVHFDGHVAAISELRIGAAAAGGLMKQVANGY